MPCWNEPGLLKFGIFSDFGNLSVLQNLSYRLTEGCTFTSPHVTQRRIFFYIFHSNIALFCLFSTAREAQGISWLCTKYVDAEKVHLVPPEFPELCRYSPCAGAVCDSPRQSLPADPWSGTSPSLRSCESFPLPLVVGNTAAEISSCICLHRRVTQTKIKANELVQNQIASLAIKKQDALVLDLFWFCIYDIAFILFLLSIYEFLHFSLFWVLVCGTVCRCVSIMV